MQIFKDIGNGTVKVITATDSDTFTNDEARGAAIGWALIGGIGMSLLARKRTSEGKEAILGFIA